MTNRQRKLCWEKVIRLLNRRVMLRNMLLIPLRCRMHCVVLALIGNLSYIDNPQSFLGEGVELPSK